MNPDLSSFVGMVQALALAQSREKVIDTLKSSARSLLGADGTTVVFRDGDQCFYVAEDAMAPLFAPNKFPMSACVSGWVMLNKKAVAIPDIYVDPRVPIEVYRPTFVKGMGMVPIRSRDPIGAVGFYWARQYQMSEREFQLAQALADSAAVALQNVAALETLEHRVRERTEQLTALNEDLKLFAGTVAHDLRSPLSVVLMNCNTLIERPPAAEAVRKELLSDIRLTAREMGQMLEGLLALSQVNSAPLEPQQLDLSILAGEAVSGLQRAEPARQVAVEIEPRLEAVADARLMRIAIANLLHNAWKYTGRREGAQIRFGRDQTAEGRAFVVRDNGAGFDASKGELFRAFQRFHRRSEFEGTGLGLTTVHRAISRHGGKIWAQSQPEAGASFFFQLP